MKTNPHRTRPAPELEGARISVRRFSRLLASAAVALVALAAAPAAFAGSSPDGSYSFVKASGSATFAGETYELTPDMIDELGIVSKTSLKVKNRKVNLDRNAAKRLIDQLSKELGVPIDTTVKGPRTVTLRKSGASWTGRTKTPVVVKFSTTYAGEKISGTLRSHFKVKIRGKKMKMATPISGSVLGYKIKAEALAVFRR